MRIRAQHHRLASTNGLIQSSARSFSSLAHAPEEFAASHDDDYADQEHSSIVLLRREVKELPKHCTTCTCQQHHFATSLPPPLPEPQYSVRRRVLPAHLVALNSPTGRQMLIESMTRDSAAPYIMLTEHFCNQSDPAFCGVTTLLMVLNALAVDPMVRWKGGWRYFGDETVLLSSCCLPAEYVRRVGVTMEQLQQMAVCHGLQVQMERPSHERTVDVFRTHIQEFLQQENQGIVVVSYSRSALGQTGEGHFSPIAAYHEESDQVLILDVARFKYQPYWVPVSVLYESMTRIDKVTSKPRGWYLMRPPLPSSSYKGLTITSEERRPASLVPLVGKGVPLCPLHPVKIDFCQAVRPRHQKEK